MLAFSMVPMFSAFLHRWMRSSGMELSLHGVTPENLELITFSHSKGNAMSCPFLGCIVADCNVSVYKDDWSYCM